MVTFKEVHISEAIDAVPFCGAPPSVLVLSPHAYLKDANGTKPTWLLLNERWCPCCVAMYEASK